MLESAEKMAFRLPTAFVLTLACVLPASGAGDIETPAGGDLAATSARIGQAPEFCASISEGHQICTWLYRKSEHIVCEYGTTRLLGGSCVRSPDNEAMHTFARSKRGKGAHRPPDRREQRAAARATVEGAKRLADVIRLVGAGPRWCAAGSSLTCSWFLTRRTPGYNTFGRYANAPGKKLNLLCAFSGPTEARAPGSCTTTVRGSPAPPTR